MNCPHCGAQHDPETDGRFCANCGMSVIKFASTKSPEAAKEEKEPPTVRCRHCGVLSPPPICVGCGTKLSMPDDWEGEWDEE